ncbi:hypothetical protein [Massilia genomosp. 1]|uniref:Uncharacterized protein n=1 Tax=Massilia genomosp. 1 TaxID=2609280 RepID=A0ABX0MUX6_9BURK|nr:hypothetical protein [Massilia genomosp. 1]NHZ64480.1 hypothetical protein [Massilia genomosp. 1]
MSGTISCNGMKVSLFTVETNCDKLHLQFNNQAGIVHPRSIAANHEEMLILQQFLAGWHTRSAVTGRKNQYRRSVPAPPPRTNRWFGLDQMAAQDAVVIMAAAQYTVVPELVQMGQRRKGRTARMRAHSWRILSCSGRRQARYNRLTLT